MWLMQRPALIEHCRLFLLDALRCSTLADTGPVLLHRKKEVSNKINLLDDLGQHRSPYFNTHGRK